jgi:hypothetical protein
MSGRASHPQVLVHNGVHRTYEVVMTPADRRITELIDKWLASIDLHLKYVELNDAAYARVQPWPKHDRPTRWVLEVARQKILELKGQCETRHAMGDGKFSESLELMAFLANLVGIQHIQRFIPLADPAHTEPAPSSQTVEAAQPAAKPRPAGEDATREMPKLKAAALPARAVEEPVRPVAVPPQKRTDGVKPSAKLAPALTPARAPTKTIPANDVRGKIIADAIRLLRWGKSWHELAELIERIA